MKRHKKRDSRTYQCTRRLSMQSLEARCVLAGDTLFCVPAVPAASSYEGEIASVQPTQAGNADAAIISAASSSKLIPTGSEPAEGEVVSATGYSPYDSSGDRFVTPLDALNVLVHLSQVQRGTAVIDAEAVRRFDTSGDNDVTPVDALRVLNEQAKYTRQQGGTLNVPLATWGVTPSLVGNSLTTEDLSLRLDLADEVDAVFGLLHSSVGAPAPVSLSNFIVGGAIQLSHSQVVGLFAPQPNSDLRFSFWTDIEQNAVQTSIEVTWKPPADSGPNLVEDAENGLTNIVDQTHSSYPLIQDSVVSQGTHAFHLAHPTASSNWFAINQSLSIRSDTKLFFMSRLNWATPTQIAKVQLSTDGGVTWPATVFSQAGSATAPAGDGGFVFQQVDLSAFAGQSVRIRFFYEFAGGSRFPQTTTDIGWVIDDIRVASAFETTAYSIGQPTALEQSMLEFINRARADGIVEANRLAGDTSFANAYSQFGINPANIVSQYTASIANGFIDRHAQPLAFNAVLLQSARLHSQDLLTNAFQGHTSSSNPPSPFQSGFSATERAQSLGYNGGVAENVYSYSTSVPFAHASFTVDWGNETPGAEGYNPAFAGQGMQNPAGHRRNLHNGDFNEAGIGIVMGTNGSVGPQLVTQTFSDSGVALVTGVVYSDQDNNDFYTPGEGRGNIRVEVQGAAFHAMTSTSGGYAVPVAGDGTYLVTFSGEGIQTWSTQVVVANKSNVKLDYILTA
jgi:uncharacterized protein YkwD